MLSETSLHEGDVSKALKELQDQVRKDPSNAKYRVFLFQLLAVEGQWERANTQLKVAGDLDASTLAMVQTYREALKCEVLRAEIFAGKRSPLVFGQPQQWLALLIESLKLAGEGEAQRSQELRAEAFEAAPATAGTIDGQALAWIADADQRLGPVLETIVAGKYWWVPFDRIKRIAFEAPVDLRDLVWMPAEFTWANGGQTVGLVPTRYPGTESAADPKLRLARRTEWVDQGNDLFFGLGQRMLATDQDEYPLMTVRQIELDTAADGDPS